MSTYEKTAVLITRLVFGLCFLFGLGGVCSLFVKFAFKEYRAEVSMGTIVASAAFYSVTGVVGLGLSERLGKFLAKEL